MNKSKKITRLNGRISNSTKSVDKPMEILKLTDVLCCVCKSVLVEPVSLPCNHRFCRSCWLATDALRCLLCRKRVGSWLRESTRRNHLVDEELWTQIREQFSTEITKKMNGLDVHFPEEIIPRRLSVPGEIRAEYEAELKRLAAERLLLENKSSKETELLIRKLQEEEEAAHQAYMDKLKQDEDLARQLQEAEDKQAKLAKHFDIPPTPKSKAICNRKSKSTIERFLVKKSVDVKEINKTDATAAAHKEETSEILQNLPKYGCFMEDFTDTKLLKNSITNPQKQPLINSTIDQFVIKSDSKSSEKVSAPKPTIITKAAQKQMCPDPPSMTLHQTVPMSLPYSEMLAKSVATLKENALTSNDSVNSMEQELCYFKPIQSTVVTLRTKAESKEALRVPAVRPSPARDVERTPPRPPDYRRGLELLRGELDSPSAFVCLIQLQVGSSKRDISDIKIKSYNPQNKDMSKHIHEFRRKPISKVSKEDRFQKLRRTRSTSNIPKMMKESSGKKIASRPKRKSQSEIKISTQLGYDSLKLKIDRVKLVSRNLSSPLEMCGAVMLNKYKSGECAEEQVRRDAELALRMEAEWGACAGGGYALRRVSAKRRPALPHALMLAPNKKIKV